MPEVEHPPLPQDTPDLPTLLKVRRERRAQVRKDKRKRRRDRAEDRVKARRNRAEHRRALRDVDETTRTREHERAERAADRAEQTAVGALWRRATVSGARARLIAQISQSAEARRLRVQAVRTWTLRIGIPVLLGFGLWSTSGVHAGVVTALALTPGTLSWWAAWAVEPGLITVVAAVIVGRSILRTAGGDVDWRALAVMGGALLVSLALSVLPVWPTVWGPEAVAALVAKTLGPVGTALVAHLIGMFDDYAASATPEKNAETLETMRLERPAPPGTVPSLPHQEVAPAVGADRETVPAVEAGDEEETPAPWEPAEEPAPFVPTDEPSRDPWEDAPPADAAFTPWDLPAPSGAGSTVAPIPVDDGFWPALDAAGEKVTDAQRAAQPPADVIGYQPAPYEGPRFEQVVAAYLESVAAVERGELGRALSGRGMCKMVNVDPNNRSFPNAVLREVQARQRPSTSPVPGSTDALF